MLVTTSIGLAHATSGAVHLASFGGISRAVFPVTIMLNGAADEGDREGFSIVPVLSTLMLGLGLALLVAAFARRRWLRG